MQISSGITYGRYDSMTLIRCRGSIKNKRGRGAKNRKRREGGKAYELGYRSGARYFRQILARRRNKPAYKVHASFAFLVSAYFSRTEIRARARARETTVNRKVSRQRGDGWLRADDVAVKSRKATLGFVSHRHPGDVGPINARRSGGSFVCLA